VSLNAHVATINLLVFVDDETLSVWARERAHMLAARHSSCVLVLNAGTADAPPESEDADWTELAVRDRSPDDLEALVSARLPAAVPCVLLWVAPKTASDDRFSALAREARAILLDSSRARDDDTALRDLVALAEKVPHARAFHDLAYLRLAPWQEVIADFFDERAFVDDLFNLQHVTIASGSDAEGYYLIGWLASRLGWEPLGDRRFRPRNGAKEITYDIVREGQARRVKCVTLESHATRFSAKLCNADTGAVSLEVSGVKKRPLRVEPLHDVDIGSLLERAMLHEQPDPVFFESLAVAGRLLSR
jgi:glucose-6-phosphate dehydrogenase assembly protein OpcA